MNSRSRQQSAGATFPNTKSQLATTQNPVFPFSSPNVDDRFSPSSDDSEHPSSFDLSSPILSQPIRGPTSRNPYLQTAKRNSKGLSNLRLGITAVSKRKSIRRKRRPALQVTTDLSQIQPRLGNAVFSQVPAKHPEQAKNRARSVVSQVGIKVLASPLPVTNAIDTSFQSKDLFLRKGDRKPNTNSVTKTTQVKRTRRERSAAATSSVVFGLCVSEHEARICREENMLESAVMLVTPETTSSGSPTSIYSKSTSNIHRTETSKGLTLRPQLPRRYASSDSNIKRRLSSDSQEQILAESCDTARPKSQGWWNLVLSPILSRAGTLKAQRPADGGSVPPVPPIPSDVEQDLALQTPVTVMSPDTPRRQGLANVRASTWSRWTDWEDEKVSAEDHASNPEQGVPVIPRDYLFNNSATQVPLFLADEYKPGGLAAEYYHACAVDQQADTTYFECVNHSCADSLPVLQSNCDEQKTCYPAVTKSVGDKNWHHGATYPPVTTNPRANDASSMTTVPRSSERKTIKPVKVDTYVGMQGPTSPTESEIDAGEIVSPNIRQANVAAFSRAKTVEPREVSPTRPLSGTKPTTKQLNIIPTKLVSQQHVPSPGPISPDAVRSIAPTGAMPLAPIQSVSAEKSVPLLAPIPQASHALVPPYQPPATFFYPYAQPGTYHYAPYPPPQPYPIAYPVPAHMGGEAKPYGSTPSSALSSPTKTTDHAIHNVEQSRKIRKERSRKTEDGKKKRRVKIFGFPCCFGQSGAKGNRKKCWIISIAVILIIIIILCILLAILLTRGGRVSPVDSQWLNLTGYPPMPTGVSTIAQPNLVASQDQCTAQSILWSCSLPKEDQVGIGTNQPNQPNFRFQINFRNGTVPANLAIPVSGRASDQSTDDSFVPNPTPPGRTDQIFLGNTTDNVTQPFDGEVTPFFITFMSADAGQPSTENGRQRLAMRQVSGGDTTNSIPAPALNRDGTAAPASLLPTTPFPNSQPIKLYNRGLRDEHYGFYMYYDKSIFLSLGNSSSSNGNQAATSPNQNGGSAKQAASLRCTWSQTRFVVKMYTNRAFGASLLAGPTTNSVNSPARTGSTNSATNFNRPGSFPYPTTVLLDRHGGDVNKKLVYCYGMSNQQIVSSNKALVAEFRAAGGVLINPAPLLLNSTFDTGVGGMDGGTGGCGCTWQNWT